MTHCTNRCRSKIHTYELNVAAQNGTTAQAKAFVSTCHNAFRGLDKNGRNLLHVAAANGKYELISWLLEKGKGSLNTKDKESGWTALHRAVFYGQLSCAVNLLQNGASRTCKDNESLTALELCTLDRSYLPFVQTNKEIGVYNVYTWGDNSSYTLGHGKESQALLPSVVDGFRRKQITIKKVLMRRYHSIFLTSDGAIYTCGYGNGGRLGLGHENPTLNPSKVKLPQTSQPMADGSGDTSSTVVIDDIAAGRDHTLLLGANGRVYSCGSNDHKQLGISDPSGKVSEPKMVNAKALIKGPPVKHIAAARFHSVVATDTSVYTFGLNAGQLGHAKGDDRHLPPRLVSALANQSDCRIKLIGCCDAATVVVMSAERREGFHILYQYKTKYVSFRGAKFDKRVSRLTVVGGELDQSMLLEGRVTAPLSIYWTNMVGQLFIWTEDGGGLIRKVTYTSLGRQLNVLDISSSLSELLITTEQGGAYVLTASEKASASNDSARLPPVVPIYDMKIRRIAGVHRATQCSIHPKSTNYAILQAKEYTCFFAEVESSRISEEFNSLRSVTDEFDGICDVVLKCRAERIACHKFILASRSTYFSKLLTELDSQKLASLHKEDEEDVLGFNLPSNIQELNIDTELNTLQFIIKYIYTGNLDLSLILDTEGVASNSTNKTSNKSKAQNASLKIQQEKHQQSKLQEIGKKFGVASLASKSRHSTVPHISYMMSKFAQWCDVIVTSSDGEELRCHKCILVARMEYFGTMLSGHWFEGQDKVVRLELPIPFDILFAVMLYIYTDDFSHIQAHDIEFMVNVLVVADQLLLSRLKQICESLIVSELTIGNVTQVYQLASTYRTTQLKDAAMFMMCLNMSEMLELSLLDDLDLELLDELTRYYRSKLSCTGRRHLSKASDGPSSEEMNRVIKDQQEDLSSQNRRARRRTRTSSNSSNDSDVGRPALEELKLDDGDFAEEFTDAVTESADKLPENTPTTESTPEVITESKTSSSTHHKRSNPNRLGQETITSPKSPPYTNLRSSPPVPSTPPTYGSGGGPPSLRDIMNQERNSGTQHSQDANKSKTKTTGRRKYRSLDDNVLAVQDNSELSPRAERTHQPAWSPPPTAAISLKDVMEKEKACGSLHRTGSRPEVAGKHFKSKPGRTKTSWSTPAVIEKAPAWNLTQSPSSPSHQNGNHSKVTTNQISAHLPLSNRNKGAKPQSPNPNLQDIMSQEEIEMKELLRYAKKPLLNVQIEERAIEELTHKYMATKKPDERITVERVIPVLAIPQWGNQSH